MKAPDNSSIMKYVFDQIHVRVKELEKDPNYKTFTVNTKKHYKIWFSGDPDNFLPFINRLRLIRLRESLGDSAEIRLVYSGRLLSEKAKAELKAFCKYEREYKTIINGQEKTHKIRHNIIAVNFDTIDIKDEKELKIKELVNSEIDKAINNQGGDLAAASDMARIMLSLTKLGGIYSDCDIVFDKKHCQTLPVKINIKAPLALFLKLEEQRVEGSNSIIVPTTKEGSGKNLTEECINAFRATQDAILKASTQPIDYSLLYDLFSPDKKGQISTNDIPSAIFPKVLKEFSKLHKEDKSIHNLRIFIKKLDYRIHLLVMHQDDAENYKKIQTLSEKEVEDFYYTWIMTPGNIEKSGSKNSFVKIVRTGLTNIIKNGKKLDGISITMNNGNPSLNISDELLDAKLKEHVKDVAEVFLRAIKEALYIPTVCCVTGPEVQIFTMTSQYIPLKFEKGYDTIANIIQIKSLQLIHSLERVFPQESFENGNIQQRCMRVAYSTHSFRMSITALLALNPLKTDVSWTEEGKRNLDEYFVEMGTAATRIQQSWRERVERKGTSSNAISV